MSEARALRAAEDFRTKTCFCGKPLPERFGMAWCDDCLIEFAASPETHRMFIRRKEVARGRI